MTVDNREVPIKIPKEAVPLATPLSLEERSIGYFLTIHSPFADNIDSYQKLLDQPESDAEVLRGFKDGAIDHNDERLIEVRKRNLFLSANSTSFAPDITRRMIRHGKVEGLLDFLENPHNLAYAPGEPKYFFQDTGFNPSRLQFALLLGDTIGCAEPVQKAIDTYIKWFKDMWQERINEDKEGKNPYLGDKRKLIYSYDHLREFDNHAVNPFPLNDADKQYVGILASVSDEQLKEYGRKYLPQSPQTSMSTS